MAELRVLQVGKFYPPDEGGMETHLEGLCRHLLGRVDLEVLVASRTRRTVNDLVDGVPVTRLATWLTLQNAPLCPEMPGRMRRSRADIVHLHHPNPSAFLSYLASGHRGRLVVTYQSDIVKQRRLNRVYEPIVHAVLRRAAAITVGAQEYLDTSPILPHYRDRCVVIPLAVERSQYATADPEAVAAIRARFGERMILAVGRLVYYKGLEYLVRAMRDVDGHAVIVGQGPMRESLSTLAASLGVQGRVTLVGHVRDTAPYYHAARVFALPSHLRSEAFGIVQLEAMASAIPVVNTRIPSGVPSVSLDGETGITVPPADPGALAQALTRLLDDPELSGRMGEAGRRRVAQLYSLDGMAERTLDLYRRILREEPAHSRRRDGART